MAVNCLCFIFFRDTFKKPAETMYKTSTFQQVRTYEQFSTSTYCVEAHKYLQIITILKTKKNKKTI